MVVRNLAWPDLTLAEVVIVCAGQLGETGRIRLEAAIQAKVPLIAADGGLKHIKGPVEALVGDLDSVTEDIVEASMNVHYDDDSSNTDLVKALKHVASRGWTSVDIIGINGGSLGHQLAIIGAIATSGASMDVCCVLKDGLLANVPEYRNISGQGQPSFSVFSFGETSTVSLKGAKWPLEQETLELSTLGARNVAVNNTKVTNHFATPGLLIALDFNAS
ncbi:MAG: thiamine diphosphokinase [Euryarchaeota archaeon]|nr:thiamine diphosphokinase [Euryarchaeota archaeon]